MTESYGEGLATDTGGESWGVSTREDSRNKSQFLLSAFVPGETRLPISRNSASDIDALRQLVLPLKASCALRALYTSNLAATLEFAGISRNLPWTGRRSSRLPDSRLRAASGRLLLRCGGFDRWRSRREAEALKDGPDGLRRMDGRENPHGREAAGAFDGNVNSPDSAHQLGPGVVTRPCSGGLLAGIPRLLGYRRLRGGTAAGFRVRSTAGMRSGIGFSHWVRRHDLRPRVGCGREHAVVVGSSWRVGHKRRCPGPCPPDRAANHRRPPGGVDLLRGQPGRPRNSSNCPGARLSENYFMRSSFSRTGSPDDHPDRRIGARHPVCLDAVLRILRRPGDFDTVWRREYTLTPDAALPPGLGRAVAPTAEEWLRYSTAAPTPSRG
jgi:hypothetical protein